MTCIDRSRSVVESRCTPFGVLTIGGFGDAVDVAVGQRALGQRREGDEAGLAVTDGVQHTSLDGAEEHRIRGLVQQ
jgi:hypothetical protein